MGKIIPKLEELTESILIKNDMLKMPTNITTLAKNYNIEIYETESDFNISGAIRHEKEKEKFQIFVRKDDPMNRKRFTIARELGHYFIHNKKLKCDEVHVDGICRTSKNITSGDEKEVDYFAGAILMNKTLLEKMCKATCSIKKLAEIFNVSESVMTVRLDILGLL